MARLTLLAIGTALAIATPATPVSAEPLKGQDRSGSQCVRKDSTGKEEASGSCGTVCKDKEITTATGEDQASGYQYTCKSAASTGGRGSRFDWGWLGLLGLAGLLGLRGPRRDRPVFDAIDRVVRSGKAVMSADSNTIVSMVQDAVNSGRSATFYIPPSQYSDVRRWYLTPKRIAELGMQMVSREEIDRITSELKVRDMGSFWSNRVECPNGHIYGAFEFMEQGIREHGRDWVGAVLEFKWASVVRVNPKINALCTICGAGVPVEHYYWMEDIDTGRGYGCCR